MAPAQFGAFCYILHLQFFNRYIMETYQTPKPALTTEARQGKTKAAFENPSARQGGI